MQVSLKRSSKEDKSMNKKAAGRKTINYIITGGLAVTVLLAGCTKNEPAPNVEGSSDPYDKLPMTVSVNARDNGNIASEEGNIEENRWSKWINENSGVQVKWIATPPTLAQLIQKLNTLVAAGEGPDLFVEANRPFLSTLVENGVLQPIDEYIDKYSTSYKKYLAEHPELKEWVTFDDGKMYLAGVMRAGTSGTVVHAAFVRQDWLDKLGLQMPTTSEELLAVAKAFKERDPDGNGKADTVGFSFNIPLGLGSPIQGMFDTMADKWHLENGKPTYGALTERFADAIAYNKRMYEEGLVDKEYLTDKNFERQKQLWITGKSGIFMGTTGDVYNSYKDLKKNVPTAKLAPIAPLSTKYGVNGYNQGVGLAGNMVGFNKQMKNPKAAVKFLDFMIEKGGFTMVNGLENVHYKISNGVPAPIDSQKNAKELTYAAAYNVLYDDKGSYEDILKNPNPDPIFREIDELKALAGKVILSKPFRRDFPVLPSTQEFNQTMTAFNALVDPTIAKAVVSGEAYTPQMAADDLKKEWKRLGGDKADQLMNDYYQKKKAAQK
jgi:putative aldouronate transport system substrate-binding protein